MDADDLAGLSRWDLGGEVPLEAYQHLFADPRFGRAARSLAASMEALADGDAAIDGAFKDAGRYLCAMWAIYLHVTGGLTLARLREVGADSRFVSVGRVFSLLEYLRHLDYVEPVMAQGGEAPIAWRPTEAFLSAWRAHFRVALEAAAIVEPAARRVADDMDSWETFACVARIHASTLLEWARTGDQDNAYIRVFAHSHAGTQIVWRLIGADSADFPPAAPVTISVAALARRFHVSRIHIQRVLEHAQREGLLTWDRRAVTLTEAGRHAIGVSFVGQIAHLLNAAAQTLKLTRPALFADVQAGASWPAGRA